MIDNLTSAQRRAQRARAHTLHPSVIVGHSGLSPALIADIERNFKVHELIKVRIPTLPRAVRAEWLATICQQVGAHPIQQIGRTLIIYRENPPPPPAPPTKKQAAHQKASGGRIIDGRASRRSNAVKTPPRQPRFKRDNRRKSRPR